MKTLPVVIAAKLYRDNPHARHREMIGWIIYRAKVRDPKIYSQVVREYRTLQRLSSKSIDQNRGDPFRANLGTRILRGDQPTH